MLVGFPACLSRKLAPWCAPWLVGVISVVFIATLLSNANSIFIQGLQCVGVTGVSLESPSTADLT